MARFTRLDVLNRVVDTGLMPIFFEPDVDKAKKIVSAIAAGGCTVFEMTNRGDHAWEVFSELHAHCARELPQVILGAGTIIDAPTAALYINCGANFLVAPTLNAEVARLCNRRKIALFPGCGTLNEINQAEELGCEIVKIFPAGEVGGPSFVKNILAPCPWTSLMATGGVEPTEASLKAWFSAGVTCVGMGSNLVSKPLVAKEDWEGLTRHVAATLALVRKVRGK